MKLFNFFLPVILMVATVSAKAQKLPNVQEKSVRAPATIKIDGKATEWENQIQAYNKTTAISYTISNDDDKLYLVVLAKDLDIANKIINAGLTFTINGSDKAKDEEGMSITFPFLYKKDHRDYRPLVDYDKELSGWNQQLTAKIKDIRVAGIKGINDTISIYNQEGIKAAVLFGEDKVFNYELAIPLKYLNLSVTDPNSFVYSIKLNGAPNYPISPTTTNQVLGADGSVTTRPLPPRDVLKIFINQRHAFEHLRPLLRQEIRFTDSWNLMTMFGPSAELIKSLITPSWFSGEYTLAK